jgi:hypothetical protein
VAAALAVPLVTTIITPAAAQNASASCIEPAQPCIPGGLPCCDTNDACVETEVSPGQFEFTCNA